MKLSRDAQGAFSQLVVSNSTSYVSGELAATFERVIDALENLPAHTLTAIGFEMLGDAWKLPQQKRFAAFLDVVERR